MYLVKHLLTSAKPGESAADVAGAGGFGKDQPSEAESAETGDVLAGMGDETSERRKLGSAVERNRL